jgi:hypothetical protein
MPLKEIEASSKVELVKKIMEKEMAAGKSKEEALAIAYAEAKRRGMADRFCYQEVIASIDNVVELKGILKVGVTMAAEMVQKYHRSEIPFIDMNAPPEVTFINVFKPYEELKAAVQDLNERKITQIPFVMPHTRGTFLKDQVPAHAKDYIKRFVEDPEVKAWVKEFRADDKARKIKGTLYIKTADNDPLFIDAVKNGKVIDVSIGFICQFDDGGEFNGQEYLLTQRKIQIGHLAGLIHDRGKCPSGICGINQDSSVVIRDQIQDMLHIPHFIESIDFNHAKEFNMGFVEGELQTKADELSTSRPSVGFNTSSSDIPPNEVLTVTETEDNFKKIIAEKDAEIATMKANLATIKDAQEKIHEHKLEVASLKETIKQRDAALEAKIKEIADKDTKIKGFETQELTAIIDWMKGKGVTKVDDKNIEDYCLHDLRLLKKFREQELDAALKSGNSGGMPSQADREKKLKGDDNKPKFSSMTVSEDYLKEAN